MGGGQALPPVNIGGKIKPTDSSTEYRTMEQPIVISFSPDGVIEYTRDKRLSWLFGGEGEMQRVTDICKEYAGNYYYIRWKLGPFAGQDHTHGMGRKYGIDSDSAYTDNMVHLFRSYEDAVEHEVRVLNAMRRAGVKFSR